MKDTVFILCIVVFWFILAVIMNGVVNDTGLQQASASYTGNDSTAYSISGDINITDDESGQSFSQTIGRMFTFSLTEDSSFPEIMNIIVGIINWILVLMLILLVWRQTPLGGGGG